MQRGRPSGTATSAVPSSGTSLHPSTRAARAGYSAVRSGDEVKIALSTSPGRKPLASWSARSSSAVAFRIASRVFAAAVVAPRSPRRVLVMALADQLRLMVLTDAGPPRGAEGFARLAGLAPAGTPVIAIGGISAANAAAVARAGAAGIAVIGAVWGASEPAGAARALRASFP